jgi:hypothetical protein
MRKVRESVMLVLRRGLAGAIRALAVAIGMAALAPAGGASAADAVLASAGNIPVIVDQARLVKLPDRVATIVIGNPLIADATVQGSMMVITGKGYGVTNIVALDRAGAVLLEKLVEVRGPGPEVVTVYRGVERETYSCTPNCDRRIMLGDRPEYFEATMMQTSERNGLAQGISQQQPSK